MLFIILIILLVFFILYCLLSISKKCSNLEETWRDHNGKPRNN